MPHVRSHLAADPDRRARVEAIAVRVASERVHVEQDERAEAEAARLVRNLERMAAGKQIYKPNRPTRLSKWLAKIDRINCP